MKIIEPSYEILTPTEVLKAQLKNIELAGRTCYKSEDKMTEDSASPFVSRICNVYKHESVIEHSSLTVKFICDRGVTHELVRHRLAAYSQESTRYCNYSKDKFGEEITVIKPIFWAEGTPEYNEWKEGIRDTEISYFRLIKMGAKPQEARSVLPNSLKTEIVVTTNFREWRHILKMRTSELAHPQIRQVMQPLQEELHGLLPELF